MIFDDIHWAEPTFLDLIEYVEGWSKDSAILLLCVARPELLESRQGWASAATGPVSIALAPLTGEQSDLLIRNLLGPASVSGKFRDRIAGAAEGNPLFIEEMLGMLIDEERLRQEQGGWVEAGEVTSVPTPPSIQSLLAARIELLPEEERAILQKASVVGRVFWWGAVADLSTPSGRTGVGSHLQALVRKGMIRPDESAVAGQDAFRFHHILIRDAAYQSLPSATRADLHERFAAWMQRMAGERVEEYEEILGYHLEQACRQKHAPASRSDREMAARASRLLSSAGHRALERDDIGAAVNLLSRASQLSPADDPGNLQSRLFLAHALQLSGELQQADNVLSELAERASALGDRATEWRAKVHRVEILNRATTITFDDSRGTVDRANEVFTELGDEWGLSRSWSLLGWLLDNTGQASEAQEALEIAASHARSAGDTTHEMWSLVSLAGLAAHGPMRVEEALVRCHDILDRVKGRRGHEAAVHMNRARLEAMRGDPEAARAAIELSRTVWRDLGVTHSLAAMTDATAEVEWYAGNVHGAEREWRSGYEAFRRMGAGSHQGTWAACLALTLVELGRDDEALELTREGEELTAEDDITAAVPWRGARAKVLARRGDADEAERLAREGVMIAERTDWLNLRGDALMDLAEVLRLDGRQRDAAEAARDAADRYEQKGNVVATARARALVEELAASTQS